MHQIDNYYTDSRVIAGESADWYLKIDEKRMKALICDPETEEDVWVSYAYEVCPLCEGKGSHVNPAIDCNGLTAEDFAEDPDFLGDYMSGLYDQPCNQCGGCRVVPVSTDSRVIRIMENEAAYQAERAAERRMGA